MGKIGRGRPIRSQSSEIIVNVKQYFEKEKQYFEKGTNVERPSYQPPYTQVTKRVSQATGVGLRTVQRTCRDAEIAAVCGTPFPKETPGKHRKRKKFVTNLDTFNLAAIRHRIHRFYLEGELPTLSKLCHVLKEERLTDDPNEPPVFNGCIESLRRILKKDLGFKFISVDKRKHLLERSDVVALRHDFLRQVRGIDFESAYFLDETWVNENHCVSKCWQSDYESGRNVPLGKGKRLILLHAGSARGFVSDCLLLFRSKSGKQDYHDDMNSTLFTEWFKTKLLPGIPPKSVIIMDNAPYHSVILDKAPTTNDRKARMQEWLSKNGIPFHTDMLKAELYELIKIHKPRRKRYAIDEMAQEAPYFCRVIRLPPYHCHFNPIELIWADVKREVAKNNNSFKMEKVEKLTREAVMKISSERWLSHVRHVKKEIDEYWLKDALIESTIEPLIISINANSESDSGTESDASKNGCYSDSTDCYGDDFESAFTPID